MGYRCAPAILSAIYRPHTGHLDMKIGQKKGSDKAMGSIGGELPLDKMVELPERGETTI